MGPRRSKVLIVDDEDNIVLALHRVLYQDNNRYDVLLARTAEIAQQILADTAIDVLVTDVHLPEKSGMDLLSWVSVQAPSTRVIVMTAFDITGIKDRAHAFGCLRLMRKPFDVHEMRATILRALSLRDTFTGNLSELSSVDVIQMLCIARKTTALRLSEGTSTGVIHIENGELVHAVWDDLVGEDAFFRMMAVKKGLFYTSPLPPDIERTMRGDWQYLLIEGLRRLDEAAFAASPEGEQPERPSMQLAPLGAMDIPAAAQPPPSFSVKVPRPRDSDGEVTLTRGAMGSLLGGPPSSRTPASVAADPAPPGNSEVARLIDEGFSALRAGRRDEARRAWEEAMRLDPQNRRIELNLRKLGAGAVPPSEGR
jgi:response regulator of citrate/malate metabolism